MVNVNIRVPTMKVDIIVPVILDIDSWKMTSLVRVGLRCVHIFASACRVVLVLGKGKIYRPSRELEGKPSVATFLSLEHSQYNTSVLMFINCTSALSRLN